MKMLHLVCCGLASLAVVDLPAVRAAGTNTVATPPPADFAELRAQWRSAPDTFRGIYAEELQKSGNRTAIDRLGYPAALTLESDLNRQGYNFDRHVASLGARVFTRSAFDSLREALTTELPLSDWEESGDSLPARLTARLVAGSLGNTIEEQSYTLSATPSYAEIERSWLDRARDDGAIEYGVRPWRMDPYVYCSITYGHIAGMPVRLDTRCYSLLDPTGRMGLMRIQGQQIIPVLATCHLVVGYSVCPTEIHSRDWSPSASVRLERAARVGNNNTGFWYVGAQSGPHETKCTAGFALAW